ncbi:MAG: SAM-dependent methyltransferase [Candidatus Bipolaricaulia bacterium]
MSLDQEASVESNVPAFSAIGLISAAILGYEIALMRILSITQWFHFAYLIISVALLGFGASGTFLTLFRRWLRFHTAFAPLALLFSLSVVASFLIGQRIPFNPFLIVWEARQFLHLFTYYLLTFVPFFLGATCIGLAFMAYGREIGRVYAFNLLGSGLGALGIVGLINWLHPAFLPIAVSAIGLVATLLAMSYARRRALLALGGLGGLVLLVYLGGFRGPQLAISEFKGLSKTLHLPETEIIAERYSPLGLIDVVRSPAIRRAPGLSLTFQESVPSQLGLFIDGSSIGAISDASQIAELTYLDALSSALPYHLLHTPEVLLLGMGGGEGVLQALYHGARSVTAVEVNPQVIEFVGRFSDLTARDEVAIVAAEARGFIEADDHRYDLIQMLPAGGLGGAAAGVFSLSEDYLMTVEAFQEMIAHLKPGGMVAITHWIRNPPRDSLKLFAMAREALVAEGIEEPAAHLAAIRSWATSTLLIKRDPFIPTQIETIRQFNRERLFDPIHHPGLKLEEVNRFNMIDGSLFYRGAQQILSEDRDRFFRDYIFQIEPATDDRPYFHHSFKWRALPYLWRNLGRTWVPFVEWGYVVLIATLAQALLASIVLIVVPLFVLPATPVPKGRVLVYFLGLGVGFMFIEIATIQRFIRFLADPIYAISVVLTAILIFSGLGSLFARRLQPSRGIRIAVVGIIVIGALHLLLLPPIFDLTVAYPAPAKIALSVALLAPLAFFMGMPFPSGLQAISDRSSALVPWAWGINGCVSVVSTVVAAMAAISIGLSGVVGFAILAYGIAGGVGWKGLGVGSGS